MRNFIKKHRCFYHSLLTNKSSVYIERFDSTSHTRTLIHTHTHTHTHSYGIPGKHQNKWWLNSRVCYVCHVHSPCSVIIPYYSCLFFGWVFSECVCVYFFPSFHSFVAFVFNLLLFFSWCAAITHIRTKDIPYMLFEVFTFG